MAYDISQMSDADIDARIAELESKQQAVVPVEAPPAKDFSQLSDADIDARIAELEAKQSKASPSVPRRMTSEERIAQNNAAIARASQPGEGENGFMGIVGDALAEGARGAGRAVKEGAKGLVVDTVTGLTRLAGTPIRAVTGWGGLHKLADKIDASYANFGADALKSEYGDNPDDWGYAAGRLGEKLTGVAGSLGALATPGAIARLKNAPAAVKAVGTAVQKTLPVMFGNNAAVQAYDTARANGKSKSEAAALAGLNGAIHFLGFKAFENQSLNKMLGMPQSMEAMMPKWASEAIAKEAPRTFTELARSVRNGMIKYTLAERGKGMLKAGGIMALQDMLSDVPMQVAEGGSWDDIDFNRVGKKGLEGLGEGALMEGAMGAAAMLRSNASARKFVADKIYREGYDVVSPDGKVHHEPGLLQTPQQRMALMKQNPDATERVLDIIEHGGKARPDELDAAFLPPDMNEAEQRKFAADWRKDLEPYVEDAWNADGTRHGGQPADAEMSEANAAEGQRRLLSQGEADFQRQKAENDEQEAYNARILAKEERKAKAGQSEYDQRMLEHEEARARQGEQIKQEAVDETGSVRDEAQPQPEQGGEEGQEPATPVREEPRPVEAQPQGGKTGGVVETEKPETPVEASRKPVEASEPPKADEDTTTPSKPVEAPSRASDATPAVSAPDKANDAQKAALAKLGEGKGVVVTSAKMGKGGVLRVKYTMPSADGRVVEFDSTIDAEGKTSTSVAGVKAAPAPAPATQAQTNIPNEKKPSPAPAPKSNRLRRADGTDPLAEKEQAAATQSPESPAPSGAEAPAPVSRTVRGNLVEKRLRPILDFVRNEDGSFNPDALRNHDGNNGLPLKDLKLLNEHPEIVDDLGLPAEDAAALKSALTEAYNTQRVATPNSKEGKVSEAGQFNYSVSASKAMERLAKHPNNLKSLVLAQQQVSAAYTAAKDSGDTQGAKFWEGRLTALNDQIGKLPANEQAKIQGILDSINGTKSAMERKNTQSLESGEGRTLDVADGGAADEGAPAAPVPKGGATGQGGSLGGNRHLIIDSVNGDNLTVTMKDAAGKVLVKGQKMTRAQWAALANGADAVDGDPAAPQKGDLIRRAKSDAADLPDAWTPETQKPLERVAHALRNVVTVDGKKIKVLFVPRPKNTDGDTRKSISGIFTGTSADYANRSRQGGVDDGPSLLKIGSGEGSQVYGWGLYGSTVRGVAEGYTDIGKGHATFNGADDIPANATRAEIGAFVRVRDARSVSRAIERLKDVIDRNPGNEGFRNELKVLESGKIKWEKYRPQLYEQTFFTDRAPGDESHLLKWYEKVDKNVLSRLQKAFADEIGEGKNPLLEKYSSFEKWVESIADGRDIDYEIDSLNMDAREMGLKDARELFVREKEKFSDLSLSNFNRAFMERKSDPTGEDLYDVLSDRLGGAKEASEWLATHDIDGAKYPVDSYGGKGVKDGDKAGWNYVSFRDDNIRVDHKWEDGNLHYMKNAEGETVGEYDAAKGEIRLYPGARVADVVHEFTHPLVDFARREAAAGRGEFLSKIKEIIDAERETWEKPVRDAYKDKGEEEILEEIFTHAMGEKGEKLFGKSTNTLQGRQWYKQLWEKIKGLWRDFATKMGWNKADLRGLERMSPEDAARHILSEMAKGRSFGDATASGEGTRNAAAMAKFSSGRDYVHVDTDQNLFDGKAKNTFPKIAHDAIINKFRGKVIGDAPQNAYVKTDTAGEYAYGGKPLDDISKEAKMRSSPELDNILRAGRFIEHKPDDGGHPEAVGGWDYYETIFEVGGKLFSGKVNILNNNKGRVFHDVTDVKEDTRGLMDQYGEPQAQFPGSSRNSISNPPAENQGGVRESRRVVLPQPPTTKDVADWLDGKDDVRRKWRRAFQDKNIGIRDVEEKLGITDKNESAYYAKDRAFGKNEHELSVLQKQEVEPIVEKIHKSGGDLGLFSAYLYARHAGERNAVLKAEKGVDNGSGMNDAQAKAIFDAVDRQGLRAAFEDAAKDVWAMNRKYLQRRVDAGRMTQAEADFLTKRYQHYVPLRTDMTNEELDIFNSTTGGWKRNETMTARGRKSAADDPLAFSIVQNEQAIRASNANEVRKRWAGVVRRAKGELGEIVDGVNKGTAKWAFTFGDGETVETGSPMKLASERDDIILFKENGQLKAIKMKPGEHGRGIELARAVTDKDVVKFNEHLDWIPRATRWMSAMRTQYVPTFIVRNLKADNLEVMLNALSERGLRGENGKSGGVSFFGKFLKNEVSVAKGVKEYFKTGKSSDRYVQEAVENGLLTGGGMAAEGFTETARRLSDTLQALRERPKLLGGTLKAAKDTISLLNSCAEYNTRMGVYKTLREEGMSVADAVSYARDVTVNFNRKGYLTPYTNAAFMFSNAAIQGMGRAFKSMGSEHGKGVVAGLFMVGVAQALLDDWLGHDDEKAKMGGADSRNMTEYDKEHSLGVALPTGHRVKTGIRNPWALPMYAGRKTVELVKGITSGEQAMKDLANAVGNFVTEPVGGNGFGSKAEFLQTLAPTIIDPFVQWGTGKDYRGQDRLKKSFDKTAPQSWNGKERTPEAYKLLAQGLNALTGGNEFRKGWGDSAPEDWQLLTETVFGGVLTDLNNLVKAGGHAVDVARGKPAAQIARDVPFVRDTVTNLPENTNRYYDALEDYEADKAEFKKTTDPERRKELRDGKPYLFAGKSLLDGQIDRVKELMHLERGEVKTKSGKWVEPKTERTEKQKEAYRKQRLALQARILKRLGK